MKINKVNDSALLRGILDQRHSAMSK